MTNVMFQFETCSFEISRVRDYSLTIISRDREGAQKKSEFVTMMKHKQTYRVRLWYTSTYIQIEVFIMQSSYLTYTYHNFF